MKENKDESFDIDEYIKQCEIDDNEFFNESKSMITNKKIELSPDDKKLIALEKQILEERERENEYVKTLSPEEQKKYIEEKYKIVDELADLNKVKKVNLKSPKGKKE